MFHLSFINSLFIDSQIKNDFLRILMKHFDTLDLAPFGLSKICLSLLTQILFPERVRFLLFG